MKKNVDEFNAAEENQNTKRKTELDVNLIHSYIEVKLHYMKIDHRKWNNCRRLNSIHMKSEQKTFVEYRFYCKYSFYIVIKWHIVL